MIDLGAPLSEAARLFERLPDDFHAACVLHRLSIMRGVALAIEVAFADHLRRQAKPPRGLIQNFFDHQHALRSAEAAKGGLRSLMREADQAGHFHCGQQIGVVAMKHRTGQHWLREVQAPAAIRVKRDPHAVQAPIAGKSSVIARQKRVALSGEREIERTREPDTHWPPGFPGP